VAPNFEGWRKIVEQTVRGIADADLQKRAWFGSGPEVSSPDEMINQFFGDAAMEDFLDYPGVNLSPIQLTLGRHLLELMVRLSNGTPNSVDPTTFFDDPRWAEIRKAAQAFSSSLTTKIDP